MKLKCTKCGVVLSIPGGSGGKTLKCPKCAQLLEVPVTMSDDEPAPQPAGMTAPQPAGMTAPQDVLQAGFVPPDPSSVPGAFLMGDGDTTARTAREKRASFV